MNNIFFTLCNDRQNRRNGINTTTKNYVACNEANASIVNCSTSGAVAPVVSRRATTTTTLSTFSSAKLIVKKLSIVNYPLSIVTALLIAFCFLFAGNAWAQTTITLDLTQTVALTAGTSYTFYDSGGADGDYSSSQNYTLTLTYNGNITINFSSFATESASSCNDWDYMYIYDNTTQIVKGQTGCSSAGLTTGTTYTASSGTMKIVWKSDGSVTAAGWVATITAVPTYKAEWVSAEVGSTSSWCIGETRTITLQVKNTGTATWYNSTANGGDGSETQTDHDLVAVSYKWDEDEWYDSHPNTRNHFDRNIAPGETATITFNVEGPRKSGANHLRFNLIRQECCWFSYQNDCSNAPEKVVDVTVPALTLSASNSAICNGGSSTLTTNCDLTANIYTAQPYIWDWNSSSYTGNNHITEASVDRSILKFKTTGNDPMINMYSIGSFNPSVYKYVRMKYRIVEGSNPGSVEIFFVSSTGANTGGATTGYSRSTSLNADHQWHIAEINMSAHNSWVANGNVTGWRLDPCGSSNTIKMEIDWIGLFPDAIASDVSSYTASPTQTTTYYACNYVTNRPYIHLASQTVTVADQNITISSSPASTECIASGTGLTLTAPSQFTYSWTASGTSGSVSGAGNNIYTVTPTALSSTYTASVTNSGCTAQVSKIVTTIPTLSVSSSAGNKKACDGSDVTLTATSNAVDYQWSASSVNASSVIVNPSATTSYYVTASAGECSVVGSVDVIVKKAPVITVSEHDPGTECFNGSMPVTLTASDEYYPTKYVFEATSKTFNSISSDSPDGTSSNTGDAATYSFSLPFAFKLAGKSFAQGTTLTMRCDGFVTFGSAWNTHTPSSPGTSHDVISPLGYDQYLVNNSCYMYYKVTGSAGSRVLTMEWKNMRSYSSSYNYANYQVKLYEGSNKIELCYGSYTHGNTRTVYIYVTADGEITNLTSITSPDISINSTGATSSISVSSVETAPANNRVYSFTPYIPSFDWAYTGTSGTKSTVTYNNDTYRATPAAANNTYTIINTTTSCTRKISIDVLTADNITVSNKTIDCGTPVSLEASGIEGATYNWYSGNTLVLANSTSYSPTNLTANQTYKVEAAKEFIGDIYEDVHTFSYTDNVVQTVTIPEGTVAAKLEVWGAQGGSYNDTYAGGKGGYAEGTLASPTVGSTLYIAVGGQGTSVSSSTTGGAGGYNGGGKGGNGSSTSNGIAGSGGGGATHIATATGLLNSLSSNTSAVLLVAGGGGGASGASMCGSSSLNASSTSYAGGAAGVDGGKNTSCNDYNGNGGAAGTISGGGNGGSIRTTTCSSSDRTYYPGGGGGAGAGYYGGGGGAGGGVHTNGLYYAGTAGGNGSFGKGGDGGNSSSSAYGYFGGGGGSGAGGASYVSGTLQNATPYNGNVTFASTSGSTETGHAGNGYARITFYRQNSVTCTSSRKDVSITVTPVATPSATSNSPICEDSEAILQITSPNNTLTYNWSSTNGDSGNGTPFTTISLDNSTSYTVNATSTHDAIIAVHDFDYTGDMQEVTAPAGTSYAVLKVWGAQGGAGLKDGFPNGPGGLGGYSEGKFATSAGQHFYVVVGGKGHDGVVGSGVSGSITAVGGYNGGGAGTCDDDASPKGGEAAGAGGGATHIAKAPPSSYSNYQLRYYSANSDDIIIVAGGGGGGCWTATGGTGGGATGGVGASGGSAGAAPFGTVHSGGFGYGADGFGAGDSDGVAGGGGGWLGGNSCSNKSSSGAGTSQGGGGTGYIGATGLTSSSTTGGVRSGNGHAQIIFFSNGGGECVSADQTVNVTVNTKPTAPSSITANVVQGTANCKGTEYTLTANGAAAGSGAVYQWGLGTEAGTNPIDGNGATITVTPDNNTSYWVRLRGTSVCSDYYTTSSTQSVTVNAPVPNITGATTICSGTGTLTTLTATGGSQYNWGNGFSGTPTKNITSAGTYTVTVKDANGCTASTNRVVTVKQTPTVSIDSYTSSVECGTGVVLSASATLGGTVNWYSNSECTISASPNLGAVTSGPVTRYAKVTKDYTGIEDVIDYDTPGIYEFVVPGGVTSVKLEAWGAQGGYGRGNENTNNPAHGDGGKGGYATGKLSVTEGQHLYVVVGGKGDDATFGNVATPVFTAKGGFNGGGHGSCDRDAANDAGREASGAGGGATHIATASGLLSSLSGNTGAVLLVAGGGGGGSWRNEGGYGGGSNGGQGANSGGQGGGQTQRTDASPQVNGTFGQGAQITGDGNGDGIAGGGGGYYGGNANKGGSNDPNAAGGGSGYYKATLTETSLIAGNASMPNPAGGDDITGKDGNGYARITVYRSSPLTCASTASTPATITVTPVNVSLTQLDPQSMCAGTSITLPARPEASSTNSAVLEYDYSWNTAPGLVGSSEGINISKSGTYTYNVTVTLNENAACTATDSKSVEVSYKTPSASEISAMGLENGNLLWTGRSTNWNASNNWMLYSGGTYTLASTPTSLSNVVVGSYSDCVSTPTLNVNADASVNSLKIASGIAVSGANTISMDGNLVNNGTFDAPVRFNGTTTLSGSGTTTFRDITIAGRFNASTASLTISGNWTNNGTFSSTGTVTFAGGATQTIGGNAATAFNNVTFNNANGINISTVPTISGEANFTNGIVSGNVTFGSSATASAINASKNSYVDGLVTKSGSANGFTFPTGDNGNLGTVKVTSAASNVSVQYFGTEAGFSDSDLPRWWNVADMCGEDQFNHISNIEYWKISSVSGFTANFTADAGSDMHFNSNPENDRDPDNVQMAFFGSNCWTNIGGSTSIAGNKITMTGVTIPENTTRDISGNYIAPASKSKSTVLPIELLSFSATCNNKSALVEWSTATERNNDYFSLERSDDAINFTEIARVAGAGNSIEPLDYSYNDYGIHGGDNYYRLVQVDYDGTRTVSEIVVANCIESEVDDPDVQAYPNPFSGELTLVLDNFNNRSATIEVYDMLGKLVYIEKAASPQNSYETILNLSNLPPAAYTVRVSTTDFVINKNVVKN